jgi:hypothetical protein
MKVPKPVLIGGGIIAAYLLYQALFREDNKAGGTSDENLNIDPANLTYDKDTYKAFADGIEASVFGSYGIITPWEDDDTIGVILKRMYTLDDVKSLIKAYGKRYVNILENEGGNLVFTITSYLDEDVKEDVNNTYTSRGINFQW